MGMPPVLERTRIGLYRPLSYRGNEPIQRLVLNLVAAGTLHWRIRSRFCMEFPTGDNRISRERGVSVSFKVGSIQAFAVLINGCAHCVFYY